jgi:penicillin-binding protein 1A
VDLGPKKVAHTAHKMGITSPLQGLPAEAIGGLRIGVTPLEMADAYATLANGGEHVAPNAISKVVFPNGRTVTFSGPGTRIFSDGETYAATKVLEGVITQGTGTAANYGCPAAGKTGTAQNLDNAWFVGYTPKLSTAVWVGYASGNIPMANGFGGALAAPIWHDFMQAASGGYCGGFPRPAVPFTGTAFTGPHSAQKPSTPVSSGGQAPAPPPPSSYTTPQTLPAPPQPPPAIVPGTPPPKKTGGPPPAAGNHGPHGGGPPPKKP